MKKILSYFKRRSKILFSRLFENNIARFERKKVLKSFKENNEIALIYSIGKVGSATIYNSLKKSEKINFPSFHVHSLQPARIEEQKNYYKSSARKSIPFHLLQSTAIAEALQTYDGNLYIFTLIREPISRELSSIFQDSFNFTNAKQITKENISAVVKSKIDALIKELPEIEWFSRELKDVFGIDIFEINFDPSIGYSIQVNGNIHFVLIRLEELNSNFDEITKAIFNRNEGIKLMITNESSDKFYHESYLEIRKDICLSEPEINKLIESKFIQKFYPDHISTIIEKWNCPK